MSAAGGIALSACDRPQPDASSTVAHSAQEAPVTPPEDLMREHGILKRVLLTYREGMRRIDSREEVPAKALNAGADIIRSFLEDYHEHLEEQYVFPRLEQAGKFADITSVLRTQHQKGRAITDRILAATSAGILIEPARAALAWDMSLFIRMYEPHEAREDTVIFPALRELLPAKEFGDLAETFEDEEHKRFGPTGFEGVVDKVADIERSLGIYELSQFTPS